MDGTGGHTPRKEPAGCWLAGFGFADATAATGKTAHDRRPNCTLQVEHSVVGARSELASQILDPVDRVKAEGGAPPSFCGGEVQPVNQRLRGVTGCVSGVLVG